MFAEALLFHKGTYTQKRNSLSVYTSYLQFGLLTNSHALILRQTDQETVIT